MCAISEVGHESCTDTRHQEPNERTQGKYHSPPSPSAQRLNTFGHVLCTHGKRGKGSFYLFLSQGGIVHCSLHLFLANISKSYLAFLHWFL